MLIQLSIKNFALIEQLEMNFSDQFSIITGETGAGKSILLGALGLVLGNRADLGSLKDKEQKCVIEAHFNLSAYNLQDFFKQNDMDFEEVTIIRREILPSGKSRAFVNDSPINLTELQELGTFLIDIHSQQQTRELTEESYQIEILDAIASNGTVLNTYQKNLKQYKSLQGSLKKILSEKESLAKEADYNSFLLQELVNANLKEGEQQELEDIFEKLNNIEIIKENLDKSIALNNEEQIGILQNVKEVKNALQKIGNFSQEYQALFERITSVLIEMDDLVSDLENQREKIFSDPEKLEWVSQKLQLIYNLQKKHQVTTVEELIQIQKDLDAKVVFAGDLDEQIEKLQSEINTIQEKLVELTTTISKKRKEAVPTLVSQIGIILNELGMSNARFEFDIKESETFLANGKDEIQLLFSANKGTDFGLLKKVASGGEMSRIMLAVKAVLANYSKLPTIIFDEIDTGVSGEVAQKMANIMKLMSEKMQVFAITHLPQIASKGQQHYKVFKSDRADVTVSELKLLSLEERIIEIAEMLSGKNISDSAIAHAKALLN
ncbi:DNA repair protein RecN [Flavobacterium columnare]|uniref:DNA repair protein RecN n=2 Tax=Flavobacterium columnare TaxID=996 RepID=G8X5K3_FLACA|nr:DNA repair protein RecN [Flavobacterium columnare]AEW86235.1 DNA repair protein RecN [Flavobacterium columnare ATCC 49512]AMO19937.1 DNA repair protein RecN [Flavobacterium columnare]AUX17879.1 DNA repair protein RecN [Flavobacterium columnare]MEB3800806.1 DNA repair protein RecN [Flavobacterium columnare]QOG56947.1 DNA repair protein RecN [Flavobacterium columnare]